MGSPARPSLGSERRGPVLSALVTAIALALSAAPAAAMPPAAGEPLVASPAIAAAGARIGRLPGGVEAKTDAIVELIFGTSDGLAFSYRTAPTLTASEAFAQRAGNCLSLVNLFVALARSAGLDAFPVEVEDFATFAREQRTLVRRTHVVGGVRVGGRLWTLDFLPGRDKRYRRVRVISDRRHEALYLNAVAVEAMLAGDTVRAGVLFRNALARQGDAPEVWSNYAVLARRQGDEETAAARYLRALDSDPGFLPALTNLARLARSRGEIRRAEKLEERALRERQQNPYFLLEESLRRLAAGDDGGARRLAIEARRIDDTIPDIYVVLGRIDLQRGRPDRAARDFAAARQRSLALSAAYQSGLSRKIESLEQLASRP